MKFPINVTSKKTHKHSVNDENDKNKANVLHSVEEKISTEQKTTSVLLQGPKSQGLTAVPEMVRATTAPETTCAVTSSEPLCTSATPGTVCVTTGPKIFYEQGQKDINTPSEMTSEDISCERRGSVVDEGVESCVDNFEEEDEEVRRCSRASSVYDDSGFNSSASEDRDDISLSSVNYDCDYEDVEGDEQMLVLEDEYDNQNAHTCSNSGLENDKVLSVSKENVQRTENVCTNMSSEMRTLSEVSSDSRSDTSVVSEQGDRIELHLNSSKSILARNSVRNSRRQRTDVTDAAPTVRSLAHPRTTRRRRTRDCNNNVTSKDFRSYLLTPPFRLGDCFRDMGILSLVVCIVYMLFLAMVCAVLGLLADAVRSVFGKKELKDMRRTNVQSSRRRSPVSCG